ARAILRCARRAPAPDRGGRLRGARRGRGWEGRHRGALQRVVRERAAGRRRGDLGRGGHQHPRPLPAARRPRLSGGARRPRHRRAPGHRARGDGGERRARRDGRRPAERGQDRLRVRGRRRGRGDARDRGPRELAGGGPPGEGDPRGARLGPGDDPARLRELREEVRHPPGGPAPERRRGDRM
ncbi:MAG: Carbonic anhydrase, gamma class, partial [uncultured Rubrobacteraceae bacterium]